MKKIIFPAMAVFSMVFVLTGAAELQASDGCYLCSSSSKDGIDQCKYHGSDTFDQRKQCEKAGCDVTGTTSCSGAANVKVIDPN